MRRLGVATSPPGQSHELAGCPARRGRVVQVGRPVRPRQVGVDREQPIGAAPDEAEGLEPPVADQAVEQDGLGQRVPLARLVVELHLPEEAELPFLDGLPGQQRVPPHPGGALRVARRGRPLAAPGRRAPRSARASRRPMLPRTIPVRPDASSALPCSLRARRGIEAETVEDAVEGPDVDASVGHRDAGEVVEGGDLVAARPELVARARIERVERGPASSARCDWPPCCRPDRCRRWPAPCPRRCRTRTPRRPRSRPGRRSPCFARARPARAAARPGRAASLNAATAPCTTSPCSMGALNFECLGPQKGMRT